MTPTEITRSETKPSEIRPSEPPQDLTPDVTPEQLRADLEKVERRDWWLWVMASAVMLLLTVAVLSMTFPGLIVVSDPFFQESLDRSVRGLIGLVLIFNIYSIYQQVSLKKTRRQLAAQLAKSEQLRARSEQLRKEATTDPLTGLANRRTVEEILVRETARARRRRSPLTAVAFDLNNFKQMNDRYGHAAGDLVLRTFAEKLTNKRRGEDLAVRMGGDEFLLLLPECPPNQVPMLLERLRPCEANFEGTRLRIEFSSGIATYEHPETIPHFLERADLALYSDKRARKLQQASQPVVA